MSLILADSTREFLTLGSHAFSWGLSQAASGYIYDSPSSQPPSPPPTHTHPRHSDIDNLDSSICCCCSFSENAVLVARFHQGGGGGDQETSCKGLMLELWSPGWLNGCRGAQEKSVTFWVRMCGRFLEGGKKKSMWHFCLRSNSTWAAYRTRQHLEWDEDWKEGG